jgi:non-canonical purine NTP pyrophosphatase (RdgB/HAM1 family)
MKKTIGYATTNQGKFEEVDRYLKLHAPDITLELVALDVQEIQSIDQQEIAFDKAQKAWALVKRPLLIDDAAVYFEKYHLFPGTLSKFVSKGLGFEGIKRLIDVGDRAHFLLYLIYIEGLDSYHIFEGRCEGHLIKPERFDAHPSLPFDTYFIPDGASKTYAQLRGTKEEAMYLYRLRALKKFLDWFKSST